MSLETVEVMNAEIPEAIEVAASPPRGIKRPISVLRPGDATQSMSSPRHLWIVLTDPLAAPEFLFVNLTTLRDYSRDDACVLRAGDHSFIRHPTTVAYSQLRVVPSPGVALIDAINRGRFEPLERVREDILQRMVDGARRSVHVGARQRNLLPGRVQY